MNNPFYLYVVLSLLAAFFIFLIGYKGLCWYHNFVMRIRCLRGKKLENKALQYLRSKGFKILKQQSRVMLSMKVDGKCFDYYVIPDAIVRKGRKTYAVEIKSGKVVTNPQYKDTRRQLIEYYHGCACEGVLLVNAENNMIQEIEFSTTAIVKRRNFLIRLWILLAFLTGFIVSAYFGYKGFYVWF